MLLYVVGQARARRVDTGASHAVNSRMVASSKVRTGNLSYAGVEDWSLNVLVGGPKAGTAPHHDMPS